MNALNINPYTSVRPLNPVRASVISGSSVNKATPIAIRFEPLASLRFNSCFGLSAAKNPNRQRAFQKYIPKVSFDGQEFLGFKMTVMKKLSGFVTDRKRIIDGTLDQPCL